MKNIIGLISLTILLSSCAGSIDSGDLVMISCEGIPIPIQATYLETANGAHLIATDDDLALVPVQSCVVVKSKDGSAPKDRAPAQ